MAVQVDGGSNDILAAAKARFPEVTRDDRDTIGVGFGVAISEPIAERVTMVMGTPPFFMRLLQHAGRAPDLSSVDKIVYGAAPMPAAVVEELGTRFPGAARFNCYGLTETSSAISCLGPEHVAGREASVGVALPGVDISIRDRSMRVLPAGGV